MDESPAPVQEALFRRFVRQCRESRGWSRSELARRSGLSQAEECTYTLRKERGVLIMKVACCDSSEPGADARLKVRKTDKGLKMQSVVGDPGEYYLLTKLATLEAYDEMGRIFRLWPQ